MPDQTHTCTSPSCGYKDLFPYTECPKCGGAMSTNPNPNSTPTPASTTSTNPTIRTTAPTTAAGKAEMTAAAATATPPHINPFYTQTFSPQPPQPRQENLLRLLNWHQEEEEKKKAARIADFREKFEKARGFDEEDDEEFYPGAGKEGEKRDKGNGKERG
jgi:hypothetical protein